LKAQTLIEVICAAHYSAFVQSEWQERGGMILVAPPGHLKTTWLSFLSDYPGVYLTTDLNSQMLARLKDDITGNMIRTIIISDLQKLYERHPMVSSNIEGSLRSIVEEGFIASSFQDASVITRRARALVLAGCVPSVYERRATDWRQTGFLRRFIVSSYTMQKPHLLMDALQKWQRVEVNEGLKYSIPVQTIPYCMNENESKKIRHMLRRQATPTPFALLLKIGSVLRWRWRRLKIAGPDPTMDTLQDFSESLHGEGADLRI